ncbi:MAG: putative metal-binding motif-containing protein [Myxococcales bacterium]|nr:putative metal-binding motif-containing protein [Myxococcales bacterium]
MKRLCWFLSLGVLASCSKPPDSALRVYVRVASSLKADCIELAVSSGGTQRKSLVLPRAAMKSEWVIGVQRGDDLPQTVTFQARAHLGACDDSASLKVNSLSNEVQATFPAKGVENVQPLQLDPPAATLDGDRDGFISAEKGGADCDDLNASTFPGSVQLCTTEADTDCDGLGACADSNCATSAECVDPPDRVKLLNVPLMQPRLACSPAVTVELQNAVGPRAAGASTVVQLSSSLQGVGFFADKDCSRAATSVTIPFQMSSATVYVRGDVAGTAVLRATAGSLMEGTSDIVITPLPVASIAFANQPVTVSAGQCLNNAMQVELRDSEGRPTTTDTDLTLNLSASPNDALGNFSTSSTCGAPVLSVQIPRGQGGARFFVFSRMATTPTALMRVTATVDWMGTLLTATQDVTVSADAPDELAFRNAPLAYLTTSTCTGPGSFLDVVVRDRYGNPAPSPLPVTLNLNASDLGITFHDSATGNCATPITSYTVPPGAGGVRLYLKGGSVGPHTVSVDDASGVLAGASQALNINSGPPTSLRWVMNSRQADSRLCSSQSVTLEALDSTNVPASFGADTPIMLSAFITSTLQPVPGLVFYSAAGCGMVSQVGGTVTFPQGTSQLQLWFKGPTATTDFTIRAVHPGWAPAELSGNSIVPGPPASLSFDTTMPSGVDAGTCAGPFTVTSYDAAGNVARFTGPVGLGFTAPQAPGVVTWGTGAASCDGATAIPVPTGQTQTQVYLTSTTSRDVSSPYTVTGSAGGITTGSNPLRLQVGPGPSTGLSLVEPSSPTQTLVAGSCLQVTVQRKDLYLNDVPVGPGGATITFPTPPSGVTTHATLANCQADVPTAVTLSSTESQKTFYVRVENVLTAAPFQVELKGQTTTLTLTVTPGPAASIAWNGLPTSRQSGGCSGPLTLTRRDRWGNDATSDGALQAVITGPAGLNFFASADCSGPSSISTTADFLAGQAVSSTLSINHPTVGNYAVMAAAGTLTVTQNFQVTVGTASKVVIVTAGATVTAGSCVNVDADILDTNNNPVAGSRTVGFASSPDAVQFYGQADCGGPGAASMNITGSRASFSFRPALPQAALVITASSSGLTSGAQTFAVVVGPPHHLAWKTPPQALLARFTCSPAATIELQDQANNAVPTTGGDRTISLFSTTAGAGLQFFTDAACSNLVTSVTMPDTMREVSFYVAVTGSSVTNVTGASAMVAGTPQASVTPSGAATDVLTLTAASTDVEAGGCVQLTVGRQTSTATPIIMGVSNVNLSATPTGAITFHSTSACAGTGTGGFTIDHGSSQRVVWMRGRSVAAFAANNVTINATEAYSGLVAVSTMVTAYPLVRRGTCDLTDTNPSSRCVLLPAIPGNTIDRSFLVFSSSGSPTYGGTPVLNPGDANVECHLDATASDTAVVCSRGDSHQGVSVAYQVVSWGRDFLSGGVSVRHLTGTLPAGATTLDIPLTPALPSLGSSFLLFSSKSGGGTTNDEDDFPTARLADAATVRLSRSDTAGNELGYSAQVVQFNGATVDRDVLPSQAATPSISVNGLTGVTTGRTFLLFTARAELTNNDSYICKRRLRARQTNGGTGLSFRRGASTPPATCTNSPIAELAWERVQLPPCAVACPAAVQHPADISLTGATFGTRMLTGAVAQDKAIVFFAGQGAGGQAAGETNFVSADMNVGDDTGAAHGVAKFTSAMEVRVDRAVGAGNAVFAPQVVQFDP